jgi:hypothetical protein
MKGVSRIQKISRAGVMVAVLASCRAFTGLFDDSARVVGAFDQQSGARALTVPDSVRAGVDFVISASTFGSGSCTTPDGATSEVIGSVATVVLWDRVKTRGACTDDLRPFARQLTLRFQASGPAIIRVQGRWFGRTAAGGDSTVMIERSLLVR